MNDKTVTIAGQEVRLERVSARKASTALALLRALTKHVDGVQKTLTRFDQAYGEENFLELDRVQARLRYPAQPVLTPEGQVVREPELLNAPLDEGEEPIVNPRAGELVMVPSPVESMTEDDWAASGGKLRLKATPNFGERVMAVFDEALEQAEDHVYRLLALFLIPNEEVATRRRDGSLLERVSERADELLDEAYGDELLELMVVVGELVDDQFIGKARALGDRMGNALRLFGLDPARIKAARTPAPTPTPTPTPAEEPEQETETSSDGPSSSRPSSSTASPAPTPEEPSTPGSTSPGTLSTPSSTGSSATPPQPRPSEPAPA